MKKSDLKVYFGLHLLLMIYSLSGLCSKLASREAFLSLRFCLYYGTMILILGVYAIGWQQVIKRLPLTTAYANKAVTVIWGLIWGMVFFHEEITWGKVAGVAMIVAGVALYAFSGGRSQEHE